MLSITGLSLKELEPHIAKTNKHLPSISQLFVSLNNWPKAFIVTGPSKVLFGLVTSLRKIKAPNGLDQSKVPFSQHKPVFPSGFWSSVCHITANISPGPRKPSLRRI
jgi:fatty acid synthase subunit beta